MRTARATLKSKTEVWLHLQVWAAAEALFDDGPGLRANMLYGSSDSRGSEMRLARLEKQLILERQPGGKKDRIYKLTARGRSVVLGGSDPEMWWGRSWDGLWRFLLFDLPADQAKERARLLRLLRERGFGCLQGSVWLSPHAFSDGEGPEGGMVHPQSLIVMQGRPERDLTDEQLVRAAWNWKEIDDAWRAHEALIANPPRDLANQRALPDWVAEEYHSWKHLMAIDPLLPEPLWPGGYRGRNVWQTRCDKLPELVRRHGENGSI